MAVVRVCGRDGSSNPLEAVDGSQLMDALRDAGTGIDGTCGGMMSCGTCHVYVDAAWVDKLPPVSDDERMMLDAIAELVEVRPTSRLSCQIPVSDAIEGLQVEIAPPV